MSGFTARSTVWTKSQDRAPLPRGMVKPERLTAKFIRDEKTKAQQINTCPAPARRGEIRKSVRELKSL